MSFGDIFGKTWKEYRANFWTNIGLLFVFYVFPVLVVFGMLAAWFFGVGLDVSVASLLEHSLLISGLTSDPASSAAFLSEFWVFVQDAIPLIVAAIVLGILLGFS